MAVEEANMELTTSSVNQPTTSATHAPSVQVAIKLKDSKHTEEESEDDRLRLFRRLVSSEKLQRQQDEEYERMCLSSTLESTFEPEFEM